MDNFLLWSEYGRKIRDCQFQSISGLCNRTWLSATLVEDHAWTSYNVPNTVARYPHHTLYTHDIDLNRNQVALCGWPLRYREGYTVKFYINSIIHNLPSNMWARKVGRFRLRWLEDVENDLWELEVKWRQRANGREDRAPVIKETAETQREEVR
jgi:hypothetical protein